ncbi:hypothetical protein QOZ80_4BG0334010 [Eleusine coracana subsp. coracana]|nr:hypothetical protein QOZ80_4BG0334010 [Eleusine coracana subsp. coracana]
MRRYIKLSNCGTAGSQGAFDDDDDEIAVAFLLVEGKRQWGGSILGHKTYKRDREGANKVLNAQYFVERPLYNADHFRRRFRMRESLFLSIVDKLMVEHLRLSSM